MKTLMLLLVASASISPDGEVQSLPPKPACIVHGMVWTDINRNGVREENEPGVDGVVVKAFTKQSALIATYTTQSEQNHKGIYHLNIASNVPVYLEFELPQGFTFTLANQGTDDDHDSDVDPITGSSESLAIQGKPRVQCDAGLLPKLYEVGKDTNQQAAVNP